MITKKTIKSRQVNIAEIVCTKVKRFDFREAPDPLEIAIRRLTCYSVAQGVVYHCCREDDEMPANIGRYGQGYVR